MTISWRKSFQRIVLWDGGTRSIPGPYQGARNTSIIKHYELNKFIYLFLVAAIITGESRPRGRQRSRVWTKGVNASITSRPSGPSGSGRLLIGGLDWKVLTGHCGSSISSTLFSSSRACSTFLRFRSVPAEEGTALHSTVLQDAGVFIGIYRSGICHHCCWVCI